MTRNLAIWAITPNGIRLGRSLCGHFPGAALLIPIAEQAMIQKSKEAPLDIIGFPRLRDEIRMRFREFSAHIFIFSTGIGVRLIAPLLDAKTRDPAVVVVDEKGFHAISLVSGHLGGANELAIKVAAAIDAVPVITTATDINQLPSMDMVAQKAGLFIETPGAIKSVNMKLLKGMPLVIEDPCGLVTPFIPEPFIKSDPGVTEVPDIICTWKEIKVPRGTLILRPRILSLGMGCNRNTPMSEMLELIQTVFHLEGLSRHAISGLATTDVKADEQGMLELAEALGCPIHFFDRDQLNSIENIKNPSKMAEKHLGVKSVCEAAAILGAQRGRLIVPKKKTRNVTLAVAVPDSMS